jgi:transcription termination factor NusB
MSKLHPAVITHIQAMQDDLSDMMDNPDDYDHMEIVKLAMLLLDLYENIMEQHGILEFERQAH